MCKPNFVGWSGLVPISMLIENVIGLEANTIENKLSWHLQRQDRNGIENLRFGKIITSLICEATKLVKTEKSQLLQIFRILLSLIIEHYLLKLVIIISGTNKEVR